MNTPPPAKVSRRRRVACAVLASSTLAACCLAEGALRAAFPNLPAPLLLYMHQELKARSPAAMTRIRTLNPWIDGRTEHPAVHWTYCAEYPNSGTNEDDEPFELHTSTEGFYTPATPDPAAEQIVTLGDSFLSTFYVTRPIPYVIQDDLGLPVYNLAVGGWGPNQYLAAFETYCAGRNVPLVIVCTFNNDIYDVDNVRRWRESGTSLTFQDWLVVNSQQWVNRGTRLADRHSVLYNTLKWALLAPGASANAGSAAPGPQLDRFPGAGQPFELNLSTAYQFLECQEEDYAPGGNYHHVLSPYLATLAELDAAIKASGADALFVWIPAKERVYIPLLDPVRRAERIPPELNDDIGGLERHLSRWATSLDIDWLDLVPPLQRRARQGEKLYFTNDGHLNSHGNRVVGQLVADAARARLARRE